MSESEEHHPADRSRVDERLLSILVCPACREPVEQEGEQLTCCGCGRRYPVRNGGPVMLVEQASPPADKDEAPEP